MTILQAVCHWRGAPARRRVRQYRPGPFRLPPLRLPGTRVAVGRGGSRMRQRAGAVLGLLRQAVHQAGRRKRRGIQQREPEAFRRRAGAEHGPVQPVPGFRKVQRCRPAGNPRRPAARRARHADAVRQWSTDRARRRLCGVESRHRSRVEQSVKIENEQRPESDHLQSLGASL